MTDKPQPAGHEDDFMEEGGKSFSFDGEPPISVRGTVQVDAPVKMQQRDFDTGDLMTWPDGNPKWQWRVDLQTDLHESPDDDGIRSVYLKFKSKAAVVAAVKAAGAKRLERGGTLELTYVSDDHSQPHRRKNSCTPACQPGRGYPIKNYEAHYAAPSQSFMGDSPTPTPGAAQADMSTTNALDAALIGLGVSAEKLATMDAATKELLKANLGG